MENITKYESWKDVHYCERLKDVELHEDFADKSFMIRYRYNPPLVLPYDLYISIVNPNSIRIIELFPEDTELYNIYKVSNTTVVYLLTMTRSLYILDYKECESIRESMLIVLKGGLTL